MGGPAGRGLRAELARARRVIAPGEVHAPLAEERDEDLQHLLEPVHAVVVRDSRTPRTPAGASRSPRPRISRPPLTSSAVAAIFARSAGLRNPAPSTNVPIADAAGARAASASERASTPPTSPAARPPECPSTATGR